MKEKILKYFTRKENLYYDYLTMNFEDKKQIEYLKDKLKLNKIDFFIILNFHDKSKIYIQASGEKDKVNNNLKKIHNYFRINFNTEFSYKKVSKHANFFKAKNIIKRAYNFNEIKNATKEKQNLIYKDNSLVSFDFKDNFYLKIKKL